MSTVAYEIVDVFTDRPFAGNPLAVVYGAAALAGDQMKHLAREFNLSETVFVLPAEAGGTYRARIFTPEAELPFAGHPSVGAAVTSMRRGLFPAGPVVQECGAGNLPIEVTAAGTATLTGGKPTYATVDLAVADLLDLVGLTPDDLPAEDQPAAVAGCGLEFNFLRVRRESLPKAQANPLAAAKLGVSQISVFAWDPESATAYSRVFCPGVSVPEDPATGSAALGLGVWLVANGLLPAGATSPYVIHQGVEIHRPSVLTCTVTAVAGVAESATVSGHVVPVAKGEITVPPFLG